MKLRTRQPAHSAAHAAPRSTDEDLSVQEKGRRLGELLVAAHLVTPDQVVAALEQVRSGAARRLGRALLDQGLLTEQDLTAVLAEQTTLRLVNLRDVTPEPEALALLPDATARALLALPLAVQDGRVVLAVAEPAESTLTSIRELIGQPVEFQLAAQTDLMRAIDNSYRALSAVDSQVKLFQARDGVRRDAAAQAGTATAEDDAPVVQVVQMLITQALRDRASDVHIEPRPDRVRVRYRIDGALQEVLSLPVDMGPALVSRIKIMADMNIVERRRPQDGQLEMNIDGKVLDVRVSTTSTIWGEKTVMRLLDRTRSLFRLGELGMSPALNARYSRIVQSPFGMVIVSGPTGSGKTTTLYATLTEINRPDMNVMTIEDPVEYVFPKVNQIQINEQAGLSFATGLKSILRQDPDVILVGEVRDVETARIAVQSALTGHLVLSSVHAIDSVSATYRLLDMGVEAFLVTSAIVGVVAQRLVRRICMSCATEYEPMQQHVELYHELGGTPKTRWMRGAGCTMCGGSGYFDRIGVYEVLTLTDELREAIIEGRTPRVTRQLAIEHGLRTLQAEAMDLVAHDQTTIDEALRHVFVAEDAE